MEEGSTIPTEEIKEEKQETTKDALKNQLDLYQSKKEERKI